MSKTSWNAQTPHAVDEYIGDEWLWVAVIVSVSRVTPQSESLPSRIWAARR